MEKNRYDASILWAASCFSAGFMQGKTLDEIVYWANLFAAVGANLNAVASQYYLWQALAQDDNEED